MFSKYHLIPVICAKIIDVIDYIPIQTVFFIILINVENQWLIWMLQAKNTLISLGHFNAYYLDKNLALKVTNIYLFIKNILCDMIKKMFLEEYVITAG